MKVNFQRLTWENYPSTETPINADNLNRLEEGIAGLYSDMAEVEEGIDETSAQVSTMQTSVTSMQNRVTSMENGLPTMVGNQIDTKFGQDIGDNVTSWLTEHVTPSGSAVVVDDTLTIQGAAADAKKTGDEISDLKDDLTKGGKVWNAIRDGGCDPTNTTDCSAIIQSAFNSASDGTIFYFPAGRYKIMNALTLSGKNDIKIIGDGDTWNYGSRFYSQYAYTMLTVYGGDRLEIRDILFYGNDGSNSSAINFADNTPTTMNCRVSNAHIHDMSIVGFKRGIRVNAPTGYMFFEKIHISRIVSGGDGISIGELYQNTGTTERGHTIIPNNIFIDNCTIDDLTNGSAMAGITINVGHYIFIRDCDICNFTGSDGYGIYLVNNRSADNRLSDVSILGNSLYNNRIGVYVDSSADPSIKRINITANSIVGRIMSGASNEYGVRVILSSSSPKIKNFTVLGNTFNHSNNGFINFNYTDAIDQNELYAAGVGI